MHIHILDTKFRESWRIYLLQSLFAFLALIVILYSLDILTHAAIVAALGASTFIVFAMPRSITAKPRNIIGGHIIGMIVGTVFYFALIWPYTANGEVGEALRVSACALAVAFSILLMVVTDTEHPPAAGTALGLVAHEWSSWAVAFVLLAAVMLSLVKFLFGHYLRDLV